MNITIRHSRDGNPTTTQRVKGLAAARHFARYLIGSTPWIESTRAVGPGASGILTAQGISLSDLFPQA